MAPVEAMEAVVVIGAGLVVLTAVTVALAVRARRGEEEESHASRRTGWSPQPDRGGGLGSGRRSEREVRTGARHLSTEPESEEARALKQRLTEAVSDLADTVEEMPERGIGESQRLTSEEMIARAKQRIQRKPE